MTTTAARKPRTPIDLEAVAVTIVPPDQAPPPVPRLRESPLDAELVPALADGMVVVLSDERTARALAARYAKMYGWRARVRETEQGWSVTPSTDPVRRRETAEG